MLEKEGVVFDSDDGKINIDCFVDTSSVSSSAASAVSSTTAHCSRK